MTKDTNSLNIILFLIFLVIFFYILYIWSNLIIPFIIAVFFSFAIIWLSDFYKKFKLPAFFSMIFSLWTYIFIFWLIWKLINTNVQDLIILLPTYQQKILSIINSIISYLNIPKSTDISMLLQKIDITHFFTSLVWAITYIFSSTWIIFFYVVFILLEYRYFWEKLNLMISDSLKRKKTMEIIEKIKFDIKSYFVIKTIVSLITAILSYFIMIVFKLDFAIFWAFLIFILNFIPSIWSIIAVFFPVTLSLIQFDTYYPFLFITVWLTLIQVLMWNIIEPKFMWNRLNLSPLVIILSLSFWWLLWWIIWMILSVPLIIIINIILSKFDSTRPIAILLSEKGELSIQSNEEVETNRQKFISKIKKKLKIKN